MSKKLHNIPVLMLLLAGILASVNCGTATDPSSDFASPDPATLTPFGEWGESVPLNFRAIRISITDSIPFGETVEYAKKGSRFIVIRLQAMPAQKGKGTIDYPGQVRLLDANGKGYYPDPFRFQAINNIDKTMILIKSGKFAEYDVAFLVPQNFEPIALRCEGAAGAEPVHLALRMER